MGLPKVKPNEAEVYAIARNLEEFPALIEDLNEELSGAWAPISLKNGDSSIKSSGAADLEIAVVAVSREDEEANLGTAARVIQTARDHGLKVLLVVKDVSPGALHQLMKIGADDFAPYPLPEGSLNESITRMRTTMKPRATDEATKTRRKRRF